jgi:hypothetical protein
MINTDKITVTFSTPYIRSAFTQGDRFLAAIQTLEAGLAAGEIYNQEFINAKSYVSSGCEHAQHIAADGAISRDVRRELPSSDPRHDIGYAFGMNQAAKLARRLRKLDLADITFGMMDYIVTLEQINELFLFLKSFKSIIKKGRKPNVTNKTAAQIAEEIANTGICTICQNRQKLTAEQQMVHHGYQMSEYNHAGYRIGSCFGCAFLPYEFSCEGNKQWLAQFLRPALKSAQQYMKSLKNSAMPTLERTKETYQGYGKKPLITVEKFDKGTREYDEIRENEIDRTEFKISSLKGDIQFHDALVANWKLVPLADGTTCTCVARPTVFLSVKK